MINIWIENPSGNLLGGFKMKYLVTGGSGFVGSHLCETLLGDTKEIVIIFLGILEHLLKTNFYVVKKTSLAFRFDPTLAGQLKN